MEWEKLEIIEWLINNASNKEIDGIYKFCCTDDWVGGILRFFTRAEFRKFQEEIKQINEADIWGVED